MRRLSLALCVAAALVHGQSAAPNAVKLTKYILGVDNLDRAYAFYHALGLEFENANGKIGQPSVLPEMLLNLVAVPPGTKFRNAMLKVPSAQFAVEMTEFSGMDLHTVKPRIQDPGASILILAVADVDAAVAVAKKAGGEVVGTVGKVATVKDPDGYYVEFVQVRGGGASFGSIVADSEKAAAFYRDHFGFAVKSGAWSGESSANFGVPGAQVRTTEISIPGAAVAWIFFEFKGVDRKSYTPRIPDPGAAALGLQVHDIDAAIAAMKAAGGTSITTGGSLKLGSGKVGFVRDPGGVLVELAQP
jgi:catechol 2,3-dioxygenase-like lactoylglutathione lyase family enzyme